jgi:hypothetical protein
MKMKVEKITEVGEVVQTRSVEWEEPELTLEMVKDLFKAMEEE